MVRCIRIDYLVFTLLTISFMAIIPVREASGNLYMPADSLLQQYALALAREDYPGALAAIAPLRKDDPSFSWSGEWADLLEASILMFEQTDYGDTLGHSRYQELLALSRASFSKRLARARGAPDSAAALFALGTLEGFEATRLENSGRSMKAMGPARRSTRFLRTAYTLDSTLVDASLGFSLYDYWTSRILRPLHWTPLSRDKRPEAIRRIRLVSQQGKYARYLAGAYLAWILVEEKQLEQAAEVADSLLSLLGETRSFLEPCAKAYFLMKRWPEAEERYQRFLDDIRKAPRRNFVREIGALHRLAKIAMAREDWAAVRQYADQALELPLTAEQRHQKHGDLKRLEKFRKKASKNLEMKNQPETTAGSR